MTKEQTIDLSPPQNKILQKILRQQIPNKTVWAFGSRVEWKASETSDLDLVAHKCSGAEIADLKEALEESALHCAVDVLNWEDIPDSFRANIKKHYVVVQQNTVPEGWRVVRLGKLVNISSSTRVFYREYRNEGIPFYRSKEIIEKHNGGTVSTDLFIDKSKFEEIKRKYGAPECGDLLITSVGTLAVPYIVQSDEEFYFKDGNLIWLNKFNKDLLNLYLYYWIVSVTGKQALNGITIGSTQPALTIQGLKNLELITPPLPEQKAIAEVLSSLDDKIDLLRKQNKTLEDMAQTLFRKCFVEDAGDDWEKAKLSDEFDIIMGQSPPGHTYNQDSIGMPLFQGNADFQFRFPNDRVYTTAPHRTAQKFDTLVSVRAPVGKQNMARKECCIGRGVAAFRYKKDNTCHTYTYYKINSMLSEIKQYNNTGTVFGAIAKNDFASIYTTLPPDASIQSFEDMAKPIDEKILLNDNQVHTLEKLRDVLLPKLMSGKIRAKK